MPAGCEASFDPNAAVPTRESLLTVHCAVAPPTGAHTVVVSGEVESLVRDTDVILRGPHRAWTPLAVRTKPEHH